MKNERALLCVTDFEALVSGLNLAGADICAVGVSGGPDSMALTKLLSEWASENNKIIHALSVDHDLRESSAKEAEAVAAWLKDWSALEHFILKWEAEKPENRIQEEARRARYELMAAHCREHGIKYLFLAHHADDQAETVLFRLSKGSGLDGLCGMKPVQDYDDNLILVRPLLSISKERLVATCAHFGLEAVEDPTNFCEDFARPRLRAAREVLEAEGLSAKRLGVTARRLQRARAALDSIAADVLYNAIQGGGAALKGNGVSRGDGVFEGGGVFEDRSEPGDESPSQGLRYIKYNNLSELSLDWSVVREHPEEIGLRVLIKAIQLLKPEADYLPRMEKIEDLFADLCAEEKFRKRTLGGLVFARNDGNGTLVIQYEAR